MRTVGYNRLKPTTNSYFLSIQVAPYKFLQVDFNTEFRLHSKSQRTGFTSCLVALERKKFSIENKSRERLID